MHRQRHRGGNVSIAIERLLLYAIQICAHPYILQTIAAHKRALANACRVADVHRCQAGAASKRAVANARGLAYVNVSQAGAVNKHTLRYGAQIFCAGDRR